MSEPKRKDSKNGVGGKKVLGVEFAPMHLPWERRWQTLCVLLWFILLFAMPVASYPVTIYFMFFSNYKLIAWTIMIPYLYWIWYVDYDTCDKGGRTINWFRNWSLWRGYRDYFPLKLVKTADLDPKKNYLFGSHPHGILCSGASGAFATSALNIEKEYPGLKFHILTLNLNFRWPIYRDLITCMGACAVSRKGMNYLLSTPGGGKVGILIPGGAPESLDSHPGSHIVQLKNRKGFVKVAIQNGACLVPTYSFGETEIYDQLPNPKGSIVRMVQDWIQKKAQLAPVQFKGRGVFQYSFGMLPYRRPLTVVVGGPIEVEKDENPSKELIDDVHKKYMDALEKLFYDHREKYASDPTHKIVIT